MKDSKDKTEIQKVEVLPANSKSIEAFLIKPTQNIVKDVVDVLAGAITLDKKETIGLAARLTKGAIKGNFSKLFAGEIKYLKEKNKLGNNAFEKKHTFKAFSDILSFIDDENLDEDRFQAAKAIFYAILTEDDKKSIRNFELLKIVMKLNSSQISILKASYKLYKNEIKIEHMNSNYDSWINIIAQEIGHGLPSLVSKEDDYLTENVLLTKRTNSDKSGIRERNARLTDLGIAICEKLEKYSFENLK